MCFEPVNLGFDYVTIVQSHRCVSLHLAPPTAPVRSTQTLTNANTFADSDSLDIANGTQNRKLAFHGSAPMHIPPRRSIVRCLRWMSTPVAFRELGYSDTRSHQYPGSGLAVAGTDQGARQAATRVRQRVRAAALIADRAMQPREIPLPA